GPLCGLKSDISRGPRSCHEPTDSPNGTLWNVRRHQSALAPENLITLAHFSVSVAMNLAKSEGEPGNTAAPRSANRAFNLGSTRPALISLLSLSTISAGVSLGAPIPCSALASQPGTKSPTVGTSGNTSERVAVVTASGRSLPALMNSIDSGTGLNTTCTCPAMSRMAVGIVCNLPGEKSC